MLTRDFYESCRRKSIKDSKGELNNYIGGVKTGLNVAWWLISKLNVNNEETRVLDALTAIAPDNPTVLFRIRQIVQVMDTPKELLEMDYSKLHSPSMALPDMDYVYGVMEGYRAAFEIFCFYEIDMVNRDRLWRVKQLEAYIMRQRKIMNEFTS